MMGLVIEPMRQRGRQGLFEDFRRRYPAVPDDAGNPGIIQAVDEIDDAPVLGLAGGAEFVQRSNRIASSRSGAVPVPVKRCIQIRSVAKR